MHIGPVSMLIWLPTDKKWSTPMLFLVCDGDSACNFNIFHAVHHKALCLYAFSTSVPSSLVHMKAKSMLLWSWMDRNNEFIPFGSFVNVVLMVVGRYRPDHWFSSTTWNYAMVPALQVFCLVHSTRLVCGRMVSVQLVQLILWYFAVSKQQSTSRQLLKHHDGRRLSTTTWNYRLVPASPGYHLIHSTRLVCVETISVRMVWYCQSYGISLLQQQHNSSRL